MPPSQSRLASQIPSRPDADIVQDFTTDYLHWLFNDEEPIRTDATPTPLNHAIRSPDTAPETDRDQFTLQLANRLLTVKFLETTSLLPSTFLIDLVEGYTATTDSAASTFYQTVLNPLFYDIFTKPATDRTSITLPGTDTETDELPYLHPNAFTTHLPNERDYDVADDTLTTFITDFLNTYTFTLKTHPPETALTPRIIGDAFEQVLDTNRLTDAETTRRSSRAAYYTPPYTTKTTTAYAVETTVYNAFISCLTDHDEIQTSPTDHWDTLDDLLTSPPQNADVIDALCNRLTDLDIVDPSCGGGHFLTTALDVLIDVYTRLIDAHPTKTPPPPVRVAAALASSMIYGVDVESYAVTLTTQRLWLHLLRRADQSFPVDPDTALFPQLDKNIKCGNSLLGVGRSLTNRSVTDLPNASIAALAEYHEQYELFRQAVTDPIEADPSLKAFLQYKHDVTEETLTTAYHDYGPALTVADPVDPPNLATHLATTNATRLKLTFTTGIDDCNAIHDAVEDTALDFTIHTRSLTAPLDKETSPDDVHETVTTLIDCAPDTVSVKTLTVERPLTSEDLTKLDCFHWPLEFPTVFSADRPGFDLVLGNPPHGADFTPPEKTFVHDIYSLTANATESAKLFTERATQLTHDDGQIWFILPKASTYTHSWQDFRNFAAPRTTTAIDLRAAFPGVDHEQVVLGMTTTPTATDDEQSEPTYTTGHMTTDTTSLYTVSFPRTTAADPLPSIPVDITDDELELMDTIATDIPTLGSYDNVVEIMRGIPRRYADAEAETLCYRGQDLARYTITEPSDPVATSQARQRHRDQLPSQKVIAQRIVAHGADPTHLKLTAVNDPRGIWTYSTVINLIPASDADADSYPDARLLTLLLNSRTANWYAHRTLYNNAVRNMNFDEYYAQHFPIPDIETVAATIPNNGIGPSTIRAIVRRLVDSLGVIQLSATHFDEDFLFDQLTEQEALLERIESVANGVVDELYLRSLSGHQPPRSSSLLWELMSLVSVSDPRYGEWFTAAHTDQPPSKETVAHSRDALDELEAVITAESIDTALAEMQDTPFVETVLDTRDG